ncbi:hypothetical protein JX265_013229 [Neoarthrinium moseri]|uniref:Beta-lactamase-related domain-containing protein n=1 Tax=Neoarthrinium moseri TaxID=1658444 RepID=A0A9Q0AIT5_9PEZI|nr:hypothetical protein JX265_013229 [Neoarthrinium moseri]
MALKQRLDTIVASHVASTEDAEVRNKLLAASFILVDHNGIIHSSTAGRLEFPPDSQPYTTSSICWVASLTKLVTAVSLLQLVERGVLDLDADLRTDVPELGALEILRGFDSSDQPVLEPNTRPITLRQLLTHTLGLGYDIPEPDLMRWSRAVGRTATNLDWSLAGFTTPLKFPPGDGWCYGAAYDWAGLLLARVTGQPLSAYMREHIFGPCGMESTTFWPREVDAEGKRTLATAVSDAEPGSGDAGSGLLKPGDRLVPDEHEMESGGAGLYTSPEDYGRFLSALLGHRLLSPQTTELLFRPQLDAAQRAMLRDAVSAAHDSYAPEFPRGTELDHGLGGLINVGDIPGKRRRGSMMWSGLTNGRWWVDRETGIAGAVFTNVIPFGNGVLSRMLDEIERAVYEEFGTR